MSTPPPSFDSCVSRLSVKTALSRIWSHIAAALADRYFFFLGLCFSSAFSSWGVFILCYSFFFFFFFFGNTQGLC